MQVRRRRVSRSHREPRHARITGFRDAVGRVEKVRGEPEAGRRQAIGLASEHALPFLEREVASGGARRDVQQLLGASAPEDELPRPRRPPASAAGIEPQRPGLASLSGSRSIAFSSVGGRDRSCICQMRTDPSMPADASRSASGATARRMCRLTSPQDVARGKPWPQQVPQANRSVHARGGEQPTVGARRKRDDAVRVTRGARSGAPADRRCGKSRTMGSRPTATIRSPAPK
jgi:hypothetical protein